MSVDKRPEIDKLENEDLRGLFNDIYEKALNNIIILDAAPTTDGEELSANQIGSYGSDIYWNINGTVIKFTGTAV